MKPRTTAAKPKKQVTDNEACAGLYNLGHSLLLQMLDKAYAGDRSKLQAAVKELVKISRKKKPC